jgi:hypothetical protein
VKRLGFGNKSATDKACENDAISVSAALTGLVCGNTTDSSALSSVLTHLRETIGEIQREFPQPFGVNETPHRLFCPFLARSILEVSAAAMIARIDPFRILTLREIQAQGAYDLGQKVGVSVQWTGDVLSKKNKKELDLWSIDQSPESMTRALLGDYHDIIFWRPAFLNFADACDQLQTPGSWTSELLSTEPESFIPKMRKLANSTYSNASKGVHHEFVVQRASYYDEMTLRTMCETSIKVISSLAVVANFCPYFAWRLDTSSALTAFERLQ